MLKHFLRGAVQQRIKADAAKYEPLAQYQVADSPTWAHPVLVGKRMLIKDQTRLACVALEE